MSEQFIPIETAPTILNLQDEALRDAGNSTGDPRSFRIKLQAILSGTILDDSAFITKKPEEREILLNEIDQLNQQIAENKHRIDNLKDNIEKNKNRISEYKDKRESFLAGGLNRELLTDHIDVFNPLKFGITSFFLAMLSVFIFFFYVAVVYKALIMSPMAIANQLSQGSWGANILPNWYEVSRAMIENPMVIFAPFVFLGFAYAMHTLLNLHDKLKYLWITLVLIITFILDYMLADLIHTQRNEAYAIMDLPPAGKFSDILIVLILGFVVYIIWSIIFHAWMVELEKRNIPSRLGRLIKTLQRENEKYENDISKLNMENETKNQEISQRKRILEIRSIPHSVIINSLTTYIHGWYRFLTMFRDEELKEKLLQGCDEVLDEFIREHKLNGLKITKE
jgi:cell division protein FtsB